MIRKCPRSVQEVSVSDKGVWHGDSFMVEVFVPRRIGCKANPFETMGSSSEPSAN